ncbi:hypothetical protein AVEN_107821-1 [Araneus ventricosus]|uniref:Uncharacterized protein n=1 Tax=Araneus ventricosus TaxID=182803 RepID=A0A4Y2II35_ARAVE|nr:hypothetical protein AVEN_107821-1 [Araneus ventricosus]
MDPPHHLSLFNMAIINSWLWYKRDTNCSGIPQKNLNRFAGLHIQTAEALSFSNRSATATKPRCPSGHSPAVPPPKKKLNPSVRPCNDQRNKYANRKVALSNLHLL